MSRLSPYLFTGQTTVLTGAAGGIGEQLAYLLATRGSDLVLVDVDSLGLAVVADRIRADHPERKVEAITADLADRGDVERLATTILAQYPAIGLLINNAGVALAGRFDQVTIEEFEWVMNVNFRAPMMLTHMLLPALTARPGSHLVNVSSLFGLVAPAGQSAYSASKFALRGLSQVLHSELADRDIGVTIVHPGGIRTGIATNALVGSGVPKNERADGGRSLAAALTCPPERAAWQILDAVVRRKPRLLIAISAKVPDALARMMPVGHVRVLQGIASAASTRIRSKNRVAG
ncbi:SDR family NAD(P)-dependent oxidoreductase [Paractinoplanes hotanensis]|uniref:SDR family NAD(P)-dependent oxidoreductase n=1 Tax=Paractinoplanes hotanensis TaxID=2906497 RepID=A0ABT0YFV9_9ACTN|nr:SDR family NAD(P)-dependent oxidoreductase [Actinoplanes hotanensis]MCM4084938.1 SDR family NAD(P)-dependent oxidoreductase [Actinoplanes hotanensis]